MAVLTLAASILPVALVVAAFKPEALEFGKDNGTALCVSALAVLSGVGIIGIHQGGGDAALPLSDLRLAVLPLVGAIAALTLFTFGSGEWIWDEIPYVFAPTAIAALVGAVLYYKRWQSIPDAIAGAARTAVLSPLLAVALYIATLWVYCGLVVSAPCVN